MAKEDRGRTGLDSWREPEAEKQLSSLTRAARDLEIGRCRALARIAQSRHYRFEGCATLSEYGRRFGLRPCETWDRAKAGFLLEMRPDLETALRTGELSLQAAAALYDVISLRDEDADAWIALARAQPTPEFCLRVEEHLAARRLGGPPIRMTFLVSSTGKQLFDRAKNIAERKAQHTLSEGDALELITDDFLERHDPLRRRTPRRNAPPPRSARRRHIPAAVLLAVRRRDRDRCVVPGCGYQGMLHIGHIKALRDGGRATPANLVCLCPWHNHMMEMGMLRIEGTGENPRFLDARGDPFVAKPLDAPPETSGPGPPGPG